jgi:hypothetical protein
MADNILCDKMGDALKVLMDAAVAAMSPQPDPVPAVVTAKDSGDKTLPLFICEADGQGEEEPEGCQTGNFWITGAVSLRHSAVDEADQDAGTAKANDQACLTAMANAIQISTLETDLSAAVANFTVFPNSVSFEAPERTQDESGVWEDTIQFKALCCASDL